MTFAYMASFDVVNLTGSVGLSTAGKTTIAPINLNTLSATSVTGSNAVRVFNHCPINGLGTTIGRDRAATATLAPKYGSSTWAAVVQARLRAQATTNGWGAQANDIVVSFNQTTLRYTFSYSATFTVNFASDAPALFGWNTSTLSGASSYQGTQLPYYIITPTLSAVSMTSTTEGIDYEPEDISSQSVSAQGVVYSISRSVSPLYRDWVQQYESSSRTLRSTSNVFTHQDLFEVVRGALPFVVQDNFNGFSEVFYLRGDSANWGRDTYEMVAVAYDGAYHVKYKTIFAGRLAS